MKNRKQKTAWCVMALLLLGGIVFVVHKVNQPVILEFGMFAESNWDVANANSYVIIDHAIEQFEKTHPGVKVHYESGIRKEDYSEWLAQKTMKGEAPDVFMVLSDDFYKYASLDIIKNLDNQIANDRSFRKDYFYSTALKTAQYQESQYALPYETVPMLMFANKTLLERDGFTVPGAAWTWADLERISEAVTKDLDGDGVMDQFGTYNYSWKEAAYSNGASLFDADGKHAYFSDQRVVDAVKFAQNLEELNQGRKVTQDDFDAGNVAFMPLAFSDYRTYKTYPYKIKKYSSFQWDCITMPAGPKGFNTSEVDTLLLSMSKKSDNQKLAWEFMKLLTTDSRIQRQIFQYSQGASVLKYVTGSRYAESMIRQDMEVSEKVIDCDLLSNVIDKGQITPGFPKYNAALALAESEVGEIYENEKNVDSSLKILQREITHFLKQ